MNTCLASGGKRKCGKNYFPILKTWKDLRLNFYHLATAAACMHHPLVYQNQLFLLSIKITTFYRKVLGMWCCHRNRQGIIFIFISIKTHKDKYCFLQLLPSILPLLVCFIRLWPHYNKSKGAYTLKLFYIPSRDHLFLTRSNWVTNAQLYNKEPFVRGHLSK